MIRSPPRGRPCAPSPPREVRGPARLELVHRQRSEQVAGRPLAAARREAHPRGSRLAERARRAGPGPCNAGGGGAQARVGTPRLQVSAPHGRPRAPRALRREEGARHRGGRASRPGSARGRMMRESARLRSETAPGPRRRSPPRPRRPTTAPRLELRRARGMNPGGTRTLLDVALAAPVGYMRVHSPRPPLRNAARHPFAEQVRRSHDDAIRDRGQHSRATEASARSAECCEPRGYYRDSSTSAVRLGS